MKIRAYCVVLGAICLTSTTAVVAQSGPPQMSKQPSTYQIRHPNEQNFSKEYDTKVRLGLKNQEAEAYVMANKVAECIVKRGGSEAAALVGGTMTNDMNYEALTKALKKKYRGCVTDDVVGVPMSLINSALAEGLVRLEKPTLQDRLAPEDPAKAKAFYGASEALTMDTLGRCLAVYSPGLAYRVLSAPTGSAYETEAMKALFASTPECGVRTPPPTIPAAEQRSAVATGLFHWTHRG